METQVPCGMCRDIANEAMENPEAGIPEVRPATVFGKWPEPVCAEHDASLDSLGTDLAEMEAQDPELARPGQEVRDAVQRMSDRVNCTEPGCLIVVYRRHSDQHIVASHVHMDTDDSLADALAEIQEKFPAKAREGG